MSNCSVRGCSDTDEKSRLQCFDFPANSALQRKWLHFLRVCNGTIDKTKQNSICEKHFRPSEVLKGFSVTLLTPGAVPTIAVIKKHDIEKIGTKPGVTIQPKIAASASIKATRVRKPKPLAQMITESGMCGSCLLIGTPKNKMTSASAAAFKEIIGFESLTDMICLNCSEALRNYIVFKSLVQLKHRQIRADLKSSYFSSHQQSENGETPSKTRKLDTENGNFSCKKCEFTTLSPQLLKHHEAYAKHQGSSEQQPFQKIKIEVADSDSYDLMAQILNQNQLEQVKIAENSQATLKNDDDIQFLDSDDEIKTNIVEEENFEAAPFKIAKVDSWASSEPGTWLQGALQCLDCNKLMHVTDMTKHRQRYHKELYEKKEESDAEEQLALVKQPRKAHKPKVSNNKVVCPYGAKEMCESHLEYHVRFVHTEKSKQEFNDESAQNHRHEGALPFTCDKCGYSHSTRVTFLDHMQRVHLKTPNGRPVSRKIHTSTSQSIVKNEKCTRVVQNATRND